MLATTPPLWLIPALPALGAIIIFVTGKRIAPRTAGILACAAGTLSFLWVLFCGAMLVSLSPYTYVFYERLWKWLDAGPIQANIGFYFDRLALVFAIIVSGVGTLIHVYSLAYMEGDEGERRFFGYLNLFLASMLVLVMADNGFFMFLGWEGVGACSFFLIGHWYQKTENVAAAQKAFLVTRLGDIFLILGLLLCARLAGVSFLNMEGYAQLSANTTMRVWGMPVASLMVPAALLLLGGAIGKSAQLPLQVWLPDAMAGPTPVSALIHAATMVTAGVYLIARFHVLFVAVPSVLYLVALVGVLTAFYGATCAIVQTDIKRILAFSTISQIGYMMLGLGVGAFSLGVFHFFTHAFFKALLFLAAGAVIHALHGEQNIYNMGGLKNSLRGTFLVFLAGAASLAGIPFVDAGFFSKDEVMWTALSTRYGNWGIYAIAVITAFLTAIYSFRLIFIVFFGLPRKPVHVHEPNRLFMIPLWILAFFSIFAGYLNVPEAWHFTPPWFEHFMDPVFGNWEARPFEHLAKWELPATALTGLLALAGVWVAWLLYAPGKRVVPAPAMEPGTIEIPTPAPYRMRLANLLYHGWGFDAVYGFLFIQPFIRISRIASWFDRVIVDGIYELIAAITRAFHGLLVVFQNGRVSRYALVMLFGAVAIITILLFIYPGLT